MRKDSANPCYQILLSFHRIRFVNRDGQIFCISIYHSHDFPTMSRTVLSNYERKHRFFTKNSSTDNYHTWVCVQPTQIRAIFWGAENIDFREYLEKFIKSLAEKYTESAILTPEMNSLSTCRVPAQK